MKMPFSDQDSCPCPPISHLPNLSRCPSHSSIKDNGSKYYQEIGAEMFGNQLTIRMEKDKSKSKKRQKEWEPPCDCVVIQRPTSKEGPKIINAGCDDRIVFRVHSTSHVSRNQEAAYKSQTIAYKVDSCKSEKNQCRTATVYPRVNGLGSQEVYSDHITEGNQDIFLLRIKKKAETNEQKNRNVELEVRTPKPPTPPVISEVVPDAVADAIDVSKPEKKGKKKKKKGK